MQSAIQPMLKKYKCQSENDYLNAIKEIFQEIALLGLWRAKFYEKAAFYGGSALRILHGLDRFSEDLDFSLLSQDADFDLSVYNRAIADELKGFGLQVNVETKIKNHQSSIESAFIKAATKKQLIVIEALEEIIYRVHRMNAIKIKMEVDVNPPGKFDTEVKNILLPIPFSVKTFSLPDLFAGKLHALLCHPWQKRVKGRDWYDFIWYVGREIPVNLTHLRERLIQTNAWDEAKSLNREDLVRLLREKIEAVDYENAKKDILPFIKDVDTVRVWSKVFFLDLLGRIKIVHL